MLAQERRRRLLAAMADAGIEHIVLYGNAWQGDYLRYATDFGILEGHGLALVASSAFVGSSAARTTNTFILARPMTRPRFLSSPRIWFSRSRLILTSKARLTRRALIA